MSIYGDADRGLANHIVTFLIGSNPYVIGSGLVGQEGETHRASTTLDDGDATIALSLSLVARIGAGKEIQGAIVLVAIILDGNFYGLFAVFVFITRKGNACRLQTDNGMSCEGRNAICIEDSLDVHLVGIYTW